MTNFQYVGFQSDLGNGWKLDDKLYNYGYINHESIGGAPVVATATTTVKTLDTAIDKLNSYHTTGNLLRATDTMSMGAFRAGLWTEYANSNRYQIPSDELTGWTDAPLRTSARHMAQPRFNPMPSSNSRSTMTSRSRPV